MPAHCRLRPHQQPIPCVAAGRALGVAKERSSTSRSTQPQILIEFDLSRLPAHDRIHTYWGKVGESKTWSLPTITCAEPPNTFGAGLPRFFASGATWN